MTVCKSSAENDCSHERNKSRHCSHELYQSTPPTPHSTIMHVRGNSDFEAVLFQNANGEPYSSASLTKQLQRLLQRLTRRRVSISMLRSSFLTWAYSQRYVTALLHSALKSQPNRASVAKVVNINLLLTKSTHGVDSNALNVSLR